MDNFATPLLSVTDLGKRYPGITALQGVSFSAEAGEIHALVGANGAGKSTLMNLLSGATKPSTGQIYIGGKPVDFASPSDAQEAGVATVYQEFSLVPQLSVAKNIFLGREPGGRFGLVDEAQLIAKARTLLEQYNIDLDPRVEVCELSVAQQQMVEIARALSFSSRILILDEPSAVLSLAEQRNLFDIMRALKAKGMLILYVSHRLEEIIAIVDTLTVLRNGQMVGSRPVAGLSISDIVRLMIGTDARPTAKAPVAGSDTTQYSIAYNTTHGRTQVLARGGEVLGIGGLVGAGRSTFARALSGTHLKTAVVDLQVDGAPCPLSSPAEALKAGIAYLTEDRKKDGIFANLDLVANASASALPLFGVWGFRRPTKERAIVEGILQRLRLVARDLSVPIATLSGGNQQKVIFGRAILTRPRLLICDEPTRGVDVGAKAEIHAILHEMAAQGVAVIVISSEIDELLAVSSRVVVMRDRQFVKEFSIEDASEEAILVAASGGEATQQKMTA